ncbi:similar to Saccharomyces cerevisiae YJL123C MTC1 Protein of unknown function that may interact with ribosomes [Maudiozyma saulgeensis]|uniref:Maintenance of telomere capping protein 1 n=1 Tax=Maudiozyma saulgeensis TaxID=1789683 RepID=A0A1X7RAY3_9SACH|nr:similar to Saccharomyces cerevisiae YJL123C MTC1 Protein of unknown function that may interact with ribosomes [Kazachstania saulgeensis]
MVAGTDKKMEADELMEFLDNLPEGTSKGAAAAAGSTGANASADKNEDIMKFLDDLEKDTKTETKKVQSSEKKEPVKEQVEDQEKPDVKEEKKVEGPKTTEAQEEVKVESKSEEPVPVKEENNDNSESEPLDDPITSISNWWSSSGANTVSSLWSKTTEQATQLKNRLAQEQASLPLPIPPINSSTITDLAKSLQKIVVGETEEVLRIHLVHDLVNYSYLQYHVEQRFDQVLSDQVQGGIRIFVDEWGKPNSNQQQPAQEAVILNSDDIGNNGNVSIVKNPVPVKRQLNAFSGKVSDGEKLAFANLDNAVKLFNKAHEEVIRQQKENETVSDDTANISDIFISIVPIVIPSASKADEKNTATDASQPGNFSFTMVLKDITNNITSTTRSQGFPAKWIHWLEGGSVLRKEHGKQQGQDLEKDNDENEEDDDDDDEQIDPSEWVQDWVEDGISLVLGVVAQNYVVERMGFN